MDERTFQNQDSKVMSQTSWTMMTFQETSGERESLPYFPASPSVASLVQSMEQMVIHQIKSK